MSGRRSGRNNTTEINLRVIDRPPWIARRAILMHYQLWRARGWLACTARVALTILSLVDVARSSPPSDIYALVFPSGSRVTRNQKKKTEREKIPAVSAWNFASAPIYNRVFVTVYAVLSFSLSLILLLFLSLVCTLFSLSLFIFFVQIISLYPFSNQIWNMLRQLVPS